MVIVDGEAPSGAELFSDGRFSEALNAYDAKDGSHLSRAEVDEAARGHATVRNSKAVYAACNRAVAKLQLEMCRSCLRDCDDAIRMDPFCLRAHVLKGDGRSFCSTFPRAELYDTIAVHVHHRCFTRQVQEWFNSKRGRRTRTAV